MIIQYMSDLHLEFDRPAILEGGESFPIPEVHGDVLVLAGDIDVGINGADWINRCGEHFDHVILLFGNHEFYHHDMPTVREVMPALLASNVHLLDPGHIDIDGYRFIGNTLWSDTDSRAFRAMNDSKIIHNGNHILEVGEVREMWSENVAYIQNNLAECKDIKNIVVTHHAPSIEMCDLNRYGVGYMNSGYATNLQYEPFWDDGSWIDLWISGHTHAVMDKEINGVRCVSNCRGYANYDEVVGFDPNKTVEV